VVVEDISVLRRALGQAERELRVYFHTSNVSKFLQAKLVFAKAGLRLDYFRGSSEPYEEDYSLGKEGLLRKAIQEVTASVGLADLVFVEDTSVRVDALSAESDYPGLAVKEWFAQTSFSELDRQVRHRGNNRLAIVRSDIALHMPGLQDPLMFHGQSVGKVAKAPFRESGAPEYPWLTGANFNRWFVPEGARQTLAEMDFDQAWAFDFRVKALLSMLQRLSEYSAIINLRPLPYRRRPSDPTTAQLALFKTDPSVMMVVGLSCAGKTTFGQRAATEHGWRFLEASSLLREVARENRLPFEGNPFIAAKSLLDALGADAVAQYILQKYFHDLAEPCAITGFRTIEEVEALRASLPTVQLVVIEAPDRARYERSLRRGRDFSPPSIEAFRAQDGQQRSFGLLEVADTLADIIVANEFEFGQYLSQIDAVVSGRERKVVGVSIGRRRLETERSQVVRCLRLLEREGQPLSTQELSAMTKASGRLIRHNNANKMLKRYPGLARRFDMKGRRVRYEITGGGRAYLRLLDSAQQDGAAGHRKARQSPGRRNGSNV
jgi:inosine/xanthosine triphosphate pyrophosphatase family protein/dephospho-CoA kinase